MGGWIYGKDDLKYSKIGIEMARINSKIGIEMARINYKIGIEMARINWREIYWNGVLGYLDPY